MGLTVPAVHYSALASLPPDFVSSISQQCIQYTPNVRLKLNQIFKKLLNHDPHSEPTIISSEMIEEKENNPNNNNSDDRPFLSQTSTKSSSSGNELLERLPFTEPYFSTMKTEQTPSELSIYHKHCIQQEKFIDQKHHQPDSSHIKSNRSILRKEQYPKLISIPLFDQLRHINKIHANR